MIREAKFSDGSVRPVTPVGAMLALLNRLEDAEAKAGAYHDAMRREADAAQRVRREIADLMRAGGVGQMHDGEGTLYRLGTSGLIAEPCPLAADVRGFPAPAGDTAEEEARAGGMPDEARGEDRACQGCFADVPLGDTLARIGIEGQERGRLYCRDCSLVKGLRPPGLADAAHAATDHITCGTAG